MSVKFGWNNSSDFLWKPKTAQQPAILASHKNFQAAEKFCLPSKTPQSYPSFCFTNGLT